MFFNNSVKIPSDLKKVSEIFHRNGHSVYLVGGAVRDMLMRKEVHDYDLATDATPEQVMKIFKKVIPTGIQHGTVTILIFGMQLETTTFRTEADYSDGRHPDKVEYARTIEEDLSRRDFTMNAIAADLRTGKIKDPFHGRRDIRKKIIRTVGNSTERFTEDGLRPVRAIRFAGQLGFKIDDETFKAFADEDVIRKTKSISIERFHDEFCKIMKSPKPSVSLKLLEECVRILGENGFLIGNIDVTLIAQAPKISPYTEKMREKLSRACGIGKPRVSVKATTEEKLGFTGDGQGMSCHCVALIYEK